MSTYNADDLFVLAKRHHNTKRTYLLVNPLQAKHIPISPSKALEMMGCLGEKIAENYPAAKLVIGFAETATAIGAVVAEKLGKDCIYMHTTRECIEGASDWICFQEEHSHAVDQKLFCKNLEQLIINSPQIIFVDDEITTGKTIINIVEQLKNNFPVLQDKQIVAASIINRLSPEHERRFKNLNINSEYIIKLDSQKDFTQEVSRFNIMSAELSAAAVDAYNANTISTYERLENPRLGVEISEYAKNCHSIAEELANKFLPSIRNAANILVLGTEECMYPSLIFGSILEKNSKVHSVNCHSTTRSPIGICTDEAYPIHSGYELRSFYDAARETYIYNLAKYDHVFVLTDATCDNLKARTDISNALRANGCGDIYFVEGGRYV